MTFLIISLIALFLGPIVYNIAQHRQHIIHMMDGFVFVVITGIILLNIVPDLFISGGYWVIAFLVLGLLGPNLLENIFSKAAKEMHIATLVLGVAGLSVHATADGVAMLTHYSDTDHTHSLLPLSVLLHRFPIGLTLWWLIKPNFGSTIATLVLLFMALATVLGYFIAPGFYDILSSSGVIYFQAFVSGTILHVVFFRPHLDSMKNSNTKNTSKDDDDCCHHDHNHEHSHSHQNNGNQWHEGIGNFIGFAFLIGLAFSHNILSEHPIDQQLTESTVMNTLIDLALVSAPALLLAYLIGGFLHSFFPESSSRWMNKGNRYSQSLRGIATGLPLPICTCGVLPLYRTLIKNGTSTTAAMAFLVATPELGLDALLISIPLLGSDMTIIRVIGATLLALLISWIVGHIAQSTLSESAQKSSIQKSTQSAATRVRNALNYGFGDLVEHTAPWILIGLLIAALAQPILSQDWLTTIPYHLDVVIFALLGLPIYVCASGATPIVAVLLINGASPGAALAFLLTGPATNITTFGVLSQLHNQRIAFIFGLSAIVISVAMGYAVNIFFEDINVKTMSDIHHEHINYFQGTCLALLLIIYARSLLKHGARNFISKAFKEHVH